MNKQMIRESLVLFIITLAAGLLLGSVYAITKHPIAQAQEDKKQSAYQFVFSDAVTFTDLEGVNAEAAAGILQEGGFEKNTIQEVKQAEDAAGTVLGYVMTIRSAEGYGGEFEIALGIRMDGTVNQIAFLSLSETIGLGMEAKKPAFYEQFSGRRADAFAYSKSGAVAENEIDAISGATITTNAVTNAVNAGICYARSLGLSDTQEGGGSDE